MENLLEQVRACTICSDHISPNPILSVSKNSRIVIIGQAPGIKVHTTNIPWNDLSGNQLRKWLNVTKDQFYNPELFAIIPMGFCYPGTGKSGDLPPRKECAPEWHEKLLNLMPNIVLIILIGQYAQKHYLKEKAKENLTKTVLNFLEYNPKYFPLPHPSPRNNIWKKRNPWFEENVIPELRKTVSYIIKPG